MVKWTFAASSGHFHIASARRPEPHGSTHQKCQKCDRGGAHNIRTWTFHAAGRVAPPLLWPRQGCGNMNTYRRTHNHHHIYCERNHADLPRGRPCSTAASISWRRQTQIHMHTVINTFINTLTTHVSPRFPGVKMR